MNTKKMLYKITTLFILIMANTTGAESMTLEYMENLHIGACINGKVVNGDIEVKDGDSCVFFLADKSGQTFDMEYENYTCEWVLAYCFASPDDIKEKKLVKSPTSLSAGFKVKPKLFGFDFYNNGGDYSFSMPAVLNEVKAVCKLLYVAHDGVTRYFKYESPVVFNVLPPTPKIEVNKIEYGESTEPDDPFFCPIVTMHLKAHEADYAFLYVRDNQRLPSLPSNITIGEFFDDMPNIDTMIYVDYCYYGSSFLFGAANDYGYSTTGWITPDWKASTVSVKEVESNHIRISGGNGFCAIMGDEPLGKIIITGIDGMIRHKTVTDEYNLHIPLPKGIYILSRYKNGNREKETYKILINN